MLLFMDPTDCISKFVAQRLVWVFRCSFGPGGESALLKCEIILSACWPALGKDIYGEERLLL